MREQETYTHYLLNGEYQGTASKLANRIRSEQESYGWVKDQVALEDKIPLTSDEALELHSLLHVITNEMTQELGQSFPQTFDLMEVKSFHNLVEEEERLHSDLGKYTDAHGSELHLSLSVLGEEAITVLKFAWRKSSAFTMCYWKAVKNGSKRPLWIFIATKMSLGENCFR